MMLILDVCVAIDIVNVSAMVVSLLKEELKIELSLNNLLILFKRFYIIYIKKLILNKELN